MSEGLLLVAYSFAYVRRQPSSPADMNANSTLRRQLTAQRKFEKASNGRIVRKIPDWSTSRTTPFVSREAFRNAVALARSAGADLLLADIGELIERTTRKQVARCVEALDALDVEVWDATLAHTWRSMAPDERGSLVMNAMKTNRSRSEAVKAGIQLSRTSKAASPNLNYKHGNQANRRNADRRASRLQPFVLGEMAKVPTGEELSPSALAAALNAAGEPTARGGQWTHNTAKDLIARIGKLHAGSDSK
ncbi:hypothetical protein RFM23_27995 [Mesorhizobium abyssinicae]|uniref:Resolvase/invertase-type recombinase catalytic domain-containing protein n=1 Tax=Mesorhizobium abyssinicae TaxID=1209958 RepID=A0ABU5AVX4_9HYPH|nr:hypothetical protein [Mesorhizobium abyssinicae]MDX8541470.1 hypothetical protein [Mesorhizobium abyssinicae]